MNIHIRLLIFMTTQNNTIDIFDINRNKTVHLIYIASKLLRTEGETWSYSLHYKGITFSFSHMSDLHCFEKRIKEFGLDAHTERRDRLDWPKYYISTAYHEAAHAVIAYWFGWWVNHEGVWIDPYGGYCGHRHEKQSHVEEHGYCISLAGYAAELRLNPDYAKPLSDENLTITLGFLDDPDIADNDEGEVLSKLKTAHPNEDVGQIIARYRAFEQQTSELLRQEHIWSAIEIIAKELLRRAHLSQGEVENLLPEGTVWLGKLNAASLNCLTNS
jgi:hypothetical protein